MAARRERAVSGQDGLAVPGKWVKESGVTEVGFAESKRCRGKLGLAEGPT